MTAALRLVASGVLLGLARVRANVCGTWVDDALCMGTISRDSPTHYGSTTSPGYSITGNAASDHFYSLVIDDELADCAANSYLKITTCGSTFDTYLRIMASSTYASPLIACDDCGGCGTRTVLNHNTLGGLVAGTYILLIEGYSSYSGEYTLILDFSNCTATPTAAPSTPSPSVSLPPSPSPTTRSPTYSPAPTSGCPGEWTAYGEWAWATSATSHGVCEVALVAQYSGSACTYGWSFGCVNDGTAWVDYGCRGAFSCGGGDSFVCSSNDHAYATCDCRQVESFRAPEQRRCFVSATSTSEGFSEMMRIGEYLATTDGVTLGYTVPQAVCASMCDAINASLPCGLDRQEAEWLYETFRGPVDSYQVSSRRIHAGYYQRRVCGWEPITVGCSGAPLWSGGGQEGVGPEPDHFPAGVDDMTYYDDTAQNFRKVHCASMGIAGPADDWLDKPWRMESVSCLDDFATCVCEKDRETSDDYRKWAEHGYHPRRRRYVEAHFALWIVSAIIFGIAWAIWFVCFLFAMDSPEPFCPSIDDRICGRGVQLWAMFGITWALAFFMMSSAMQASYSGPDNDPDGPPCDEGLGIASQVFLWLTLGCGGPPVLWYYAHRLAQAWGQARVAYENRLRRKLAVDLRAVKVERQQSHARHVKDEISGIACTLCQIRVADAVNVPCGHCFLCSDCNDRFRADAGPICNACREPSDLPQIRNPEVQRHLKVQGPLGESEKEIHEPQTSSGLRAEIQRISRNREQSHARMLAAKKTLLCDHCKTNRVDSVFTACGHSELCFDCATAHQAEYGKKCAICSKASPLKRLVLEKTCDVCFDDVGLEFLYTAGVCGHLLCTTCSIEYVRGALGNVSDEIFTAGLRCPMHMAGCEKMLETRNLRALVGKQVREENRATIVPLKPEEHARLERFTYEVGIPFDHRFHCANEKCARMFDVDIASVLAAATRSRNPVRPKAVCPHCNAASCVQCKILWHEMLSCDEVKAMKREQKNNKGTDAYINATSKPCPRCGFRISHYHGHACHHIRPGTGCTNCGHHFCYRCLKPGHSGSACGCRLFCDNSNIQSHLVQEPYPHDSRCSCPICPDCRPRQPCPQCDGNCVVCQGAVPHGPTSLVKKK